MGSVVLHVIVNLYHILTISIHEFYNYVDQLSLLVIYVLEWKSLWILWIIGGCGGEGVSMGVATQTSLKLRKSEKSMETAKTKRKKEEINIVNLYLLVFMMFKHVYKVN